MILTITPNPSIDLLFEADRLVWDDANRVAAPRRRGGGQGLNLARAAIALDGDAVAIALLGGATGDELAAILAAESVPLRRVDARGETRWFVATRERETGRSLLLNPRGPTCGAAEAAALLDAVRAALNELRPAWVACCGSLPPGFETDTYARIGALARAAGARFTADCDGEPLAIAAAAGCDLLVPNAHEAARLTGRVIASPADAGRAAVELLATGVQRAAVTIGEDGAVAADGAGAWWARAPEVKGGSAVGAGDSFLAAWLIGDEAGLDTPELIRHAVAAGTATLHGRGSAILERAAFDAVLPAVHVEPLDP